MIAQHSRQLFFRIIFSHGEEKEWIYYISKRNFVDSKTSSKNSVRDFVLLLAFIIINSFVLVHFRYKFVFLFSVEFCSVLRSITLPNFNGSKQFCIEFAVMTMSQLPTWLPSKVCILTLDSFTIFVVFPFQDQPDCQILYPMLDLQKFKLISPFATDATTFYLFDMIDLKRCCLFKYLAFIYSTSWKYVVDMLMGLNLSL